MLYEEDVSEELRFFVFFVGNERRSVSLKRGGLFPRFEVDYDVGSYVDLLEKTVYADCFGCQCDDEDDTVSGNSVPYQNGVEYCIIVDIYPLA